MTLKQTFLLPTNRIISLISTRNNLHMMKTLYLKINLPFIVCYILKTKFDWIDIAKTFENVKMISIHKHLVYWNIYRTDVLIT